MANHCNGCRYQKERADETEENLVRAIACSKCRATYKGPSEYKPKTGKEYQVWLEE